MNNFLKLIPLFGPLNQMCTGQQVRSGIRLQSALTGFPAGRKFSFPVHFYFEYLILLDFSQKLALKILHSVATSMFRIKDFARHL